MEMKKNTSKQLAVAARGLMIQIWRKILLRIPTAKKRSQIKLQRLQKVEIWASGSLLHQINALYKRFFIKFK